MQSFLLLQQVAQILNAGL